MKHIRHLPLPLHAAVLAFALSLGACASTPDNRDTMQLPKPATVTLSVEQRDSLLDRAEALMSADKHEKSFAFLQKVLQSEPKNPRALLGVGEAYLATNHLAKALAAFEAAQDLPEARTSGLQGRGLVLALLGKRDEASKVLLQAVEEDSSLWRVWNALGRADDLDGKMEEARRKYQKALEINPDAAAVYNNIGVSFLLEGRYVEASAAFTQALERDTSLKITRENLRIALAKQGKYEEAISGVPYEMLPLALNNVGIIAMSKGDYVRAEAFFVQAMHQSPAYYNVAAKNLAELQGLIKARKPQEGDQKK